MPVCENKMVYDAQMAGGAPLNKDYFRFDEMDTPLGLGYR
jgi:hypothetical protein